MAAVPTSAIDRLIPEILLEIFDRVRDGGQSNTPLLSCILCCRKWRPLSSSILYRHVVLDQYRLAKFANNHTSCEVSSLTIRMDSLGINPSDPSSAIQDTNDRKTGLQKLCPLLKDINPTTLSLSVDVPFPCTVAPEVAAIVDSLPKSCTHLEIDLKHSSSFIPDSAHTNDRPHLCETICSALPRLKHFRVRLPTLCSAIFTTNLSSQDPCLQVIRTPLLETCLINLSLRQPGPWVQGPWATQCGEDWRQTPYIGQEELLPSALLPMERVLKDFAQLNSGNLRRLWIMDVKPLRPGAPQDYAAWIRRDFISNASYAIPVWDIGGLFSRDVCVARVPSPTGANETDDWVSAIERLETVAEGGTWVETCIGARLPVRDIRKYTPAHPVVPGYQFRQQSQISCMLWRNEDETGEAILPRGPGDLMQRWDLDLCEITPPGWKRDDFPGSPMVRA